MSQRNSGYARKERDFYPTPPWVTKALMPHIPPQLKVWEPAAGSGKMAAALKAAGHDVYQTDLETGDDFLETTYIGCDAIITNPPYKLAGEFIEHALAFQRFDRGIVAMLLRTDFDHAKTRRCFFGNCKAFAKKLVLTKRIVWFDGPSSPSFNHAWFIWDWQKRGYPILVYGPEAAE